MSKKLKRNTAVVSVFAFGAQNGQVCSMVDELLNNIHRHLDSSTNSRSSFTCDSFIKFSRPKSWFQRKGIPELRKEKSLYENLILSYGQKLLRAVKRRDNLLCRRQMLYDAITALILELNKANNDTRIRFSLTPTETGFSQWVDAMKMVAQLPGGIPPEFRTKLWLQLADKYLVDKKIDWSSTAANIFSEWSTPDDEELGVQIVKDLHRTGCSLFCGAEGEHNQALLKRVLLAYARWNKNVGYCQGFNMLAAIILQVMDRNEKDAAKVMIYLVDGVLPESYFANNLRGLSVDMAVFRDLLKMRLPKLSKHLEALQQDSSAGSSYEPPLTNVFTMQWFLTLFSNCLPQPTVLRVWDLVVLYGNEILLRTALAIWTILQDRIMSVKSADEFYCIMGVVSREMLEFGLMDANNLVKTIATINPFPTELQELREKYLYNISPWSQSVHNATKRGIRLFYNDSDDQEDAEDADKIALATAYGLFKRRDLIGREIAAAGSTLDINLLKQQYVKLMERQRQAHVIISAACSSSMQTSAASVNHLLIGKSALLNKGRRIGPPAGSIPSPTKTRKNENGPRSNRTVRRGGVSVSSSRRTDHDRSSDMLYIENETVTEKYVEEALSRKEQRKLSTSSSSSTEFCDDEVNRSSDFDSDCAEATTSYPISVRDSNILRPMIDSSVGITDDNIFIREKAQEIVHDVEERLQHCERLRSFLSNQSCGGDVLIDDDSALISNTSTGNELPSETQTQENVDSSVKCFKHDENDYLDLEVSHNDNDAVVRNLFRTRVNVDNKTELIKSLSTNKFADNIFPNEALSSFNEELPPPSDSPLNIDLMSRTDTSVEEINKNSGNSILEKNLIWDSNKHRNNFSWTENARDDTPLVECSHEPIKYNNCEDVASDITIKENSEVRKSSNNDTLNEVLINEIITTQSSKLCDEKAEGIEMNENVTEPPREKSPIDDSYVPDSDRKSIVELKVKAGNVEHDFKVSKVSKPKESCFYHLSTNSFLHSSSTTLSENSSKITLDNFINESSLNDKSSSAAGESVHIQNTSPTTGASHSCGSTEKKKLSNNEYAQESSCKPKVKAYQDIKVEEHDGILLQKRSSDISMRDSLEACKSEWKAKVQEIMELDLATREKIRQIKNKSPLQSRYSKVNEDFTWEERFNRRDRRGRSISPNLHRHTSNDKIKKMKSTNLSFDEITQRTEKLLRQCSISEPFEYRKSTKEQGRFAETFDYRKPKDSTLKFKQLIEESYSTEDITVSKRKYFFHSSPTSPEKPSGVKYSEFLTPKRYSMRKTKIIDEDDTLVATLEGNKDWKLEMNVSTCRKTKSPSPERNKRNKSSYCFYELENSSPPKFRSLRNSSFKNEATGSFRSKFPMSPSENFTSSRRFHWSPERPSADSPHRKHLEGSFENLTISYKYKKCSSEGASPTRKYPISPIYLPINLPIHAGSSFLKTSPRFSLSPEWESPSKGISCNFDPFPPRSPKRPKDFVVKLGLYPTASFESKNS